MDFRRHVVAVVTGLALSACGSSKPATMGPTPAEPTSSQLWRLAPADTVAGVVVADGALLTARSWFVEFMRIADARPESKKLSDELRGGIAQMPFNPLDDQSMAAAGIDLSKGGAVFVNAAEQMTLVLPIGDRKAFAGLAGGSTSMEGGIEVESFQGDAMRCKMFETRYVCGMGAERLGMIGVAPTNAFAAAAAGLGPNLQGDVQMLLDAANYKLGSKLDGIDRYVTDAGMMAAALKMERGKLVGYSHLPGTLIGEGKKLAAAASSLPGKVGSERPSGFFRLRLDPSAFPVPNEQLMPGLTMADLVKSFTGELIAFVHAGTSGSASIQLGLAKPDSLRQLLEMGCGMVGAVAPFVNVNSENGACKGSVELSSLSPEVRKMLVNTKADVDVAVHADRLDARVALGERGPISNAPSPSKLGADLLSGSWNASAWAEGLSPIFLNELVRADMLRNMGGDEAAAGVWLAGHLYEAGMGIGFREDGIHARFEVVSFAAASDAEYAGYEAALNLAVDGDFAGAKTALTALAKKDANGLAARQLGMRSAAWIGGMVMGGAYFFLGTSKSSDMAPAVP